MKKSYPYTIDNGMGERLTFTGLTQGPDGERAGAFGIAQPGAGPPMHVHYLQEEGAQVVRGRVGYQVLGKEPQFAGPGEVVVWPAGTAHKWWNAGDEELHMAGGAARPTTWSSTSRRCSRRRKLTAGARGSSTWPSCSRAIQRSSRCWRCQHSCVASGYDVSVYGLGALLGTYTKFKDAPPPVSRDDPQSRPPRSVGRARGALRREGLRGRWRHFRLAKKVPAGQPISVGDSLAWSASIFLARSARLGPPCAVAGTKFSV